MNGEWQPILVDDRFPMWETRANGRAKYKVGGRDCLGPIFLRSGDAHEMWPCLLEKACEW